MTLRLRGGTPLFLLVCSALLSCRATSGGNDAVLKTFVADDSATNVALIFGAANGLPGVSTDLAELSALLNSGISGFKFNNMATQSDVTKEQILSMVQQGAEEAGLDGTLLLYFSGHGDQLGRFITTSAPLAFDELSGPLAASRTTPLRRLIVLNDSCFSGNWVNGQGALGLTGAVSKRAPGKPTQAEEKARLIRSVDAVVAGLGNASQHIHEKSIYDQLFVFAAARNDQTAADLGTSQGGAFTYHFRTELTSLNNTNQNAKFQDLIDRVTQSTELNGHTPQYRTVPSQLVSEPIFKFAVAGNNGGSANGGYLNEQEHAQQVVAALNNKMPNCQMTYNQITNGDYDGSGWYLFNVNFSGAYTSSQDIRGNRHNAPNVDALEIYNDPTALPIACKSNSNFHPPTSGTLAGSDAALKLAQYFTACKFQSQGIDVGSFAGGSNLIKLSIKDANGQTVEKNYPYTTPADLVTRFYLDPTMTARCHTNDEAVLDHVIPPVAVDVIVEMNKRVKGCVLKFDHKLEVQSGDPESRLRFYTSQESQADQISQLLSATYADYDKPAAIEAKEILQSYGNSLTFCTVIEPSSQNNNAGINNGNANNNGPGAPLNVSSDWSNEVVERFNASAKDCSATLVTAFPNVPTAGKARFRIRVATFVNGARESYDKTLDIQGAALAQDEAAILGAAFQNQVPAACQF